MGTWESGDPGTEAARTGAEGRVCFVYWAAAGVALDREDM